MIRFNEERIGRFHAYFDDNDSGNGFDITYTPPDIGPGDVAYGPSEYGGWSGPGDKGKQTTSAPGSTGSGGPQTTSTPAGAQTGAGKTTTTVGVTTPTSAAEAQAIANQERANAANAANPNAPSNPNASNPIADAIRGIRDAATEVGENFRAAYESAKTSVENNGLANTLTRGAEGSGVADNAVQQAVNALGVIAGHVAGVVGGLLGGDEAAGAALADAVSEANNASTEEGKAAAMEAVKAAITNEVAKDLSNTESPEEAADKGKKMGDAIKNAIRNNNGGEGFMVGSRMTGSAFTGAMRGMITGKVNAHVALGFTAGLDASMAVAGIAPASALSPTPQVPISDSIKQANAIMEANPEFAFELLNESNERAALFQGIVMAAELGLSQAEMESLSNAIETMNNPEASVEEMKNAIEEFDAIVAGKLRPGAGKRAAAAVQHMYEYFAARLVDKVSRNASGPKGEVELMNEFKGLLEGSLKDKTLTQSMFDALMETTDNRINEAMAEYNNIIKDPENQEAIKLARECKKKAQAIRENFGLDHEALKEFIPEWQIAMYVATSARLACLERSWHLGQFLIKMAVSMLTMPFAPMFAIKGFAAAFKQFRMDDKLDMAFTDYAHSLVDYFNDPSNREHAVNIMAENNLYCAGENLKNKAVKAAILSLFGLMLGDVGLFALGMVQALITALRYTINWGIIAGTNEAEGSDTYVQILIRGGEDLKIFDEKQQNSIAALTAGQAKYAYSNEYETSWQSGGNQNTETAEGYNQGIGSEEEYQGWIAENINRDPITRRLAGQL